MSTTGKPKSDLTAVGLEAAAQQKLRDKRKKALTDLVNHPVGQLCLPRTVVRDADIRVWVKILNSFSFVLTCKLNKKLIHCKKPKLN